MKLPYRYQHLLQGKPKRMVWDEHTSIPEFREACEKGAEKAKMPVGVAAVPVQIEGQAAGCACPGHIHGGGSIMAIWQDIPLAQAEHVILDDGIRDQVLTN